jgi:hypothetical protein
MKITAKKYMGDDRDSWAVFVDGRPAYTGLNKTSVAYYKRLAAEVVSKEAEMGKSAITKEMVKFVDGIKVPEGFKKEVHRARYGGPGSPVEFWDRDVDMAKDIITVVLKDEARCLIFNVGMEQAYKSGRKAGMKVYANGHTVFKNPRGGWSNFDRTGVDDSFHIGVYSDEQDPNVHVGQQLARIENYLKLDATRMSVPVIGHRITEERKAECIAELKRGRSITFRPSGFGTGYVFNTKRMTTWCRQADPKIAAFFGVPRLYVEHLDCD